MSNDATTHDDYEPAFQAAEHIAQKEVGCSVDTTRLAGPHESARHPFAFGLTHDLSAEPAWPDADHQPEWIGVELAREKIDEDHLIHICCGDLDDPTILETVTLPKGAA